MKKYILELMIIIMIIFIIFWAYIRFTVVTQVVNNYEPYEPFAMEVDHVEWHGKLEPGRYTKSGIKILRKDEK
jgi:uncharacterized membrane protein (DUF106 family)